VGGLDPFSVHFRQSGERHGGVENGLSGLSPLCFAGMFVIVVVSML